VNVILLKDIDLGDRGAVVKVSDGYARNYLFPNKLAMEATPNNQKHVLAIAAQQQRKLDKEKAAVEVFAKKINEHPEINIKVKGSEAGVLYGTVTNSQLADILSQTHGTEFDKKRIMVKQLREPGSFEVPVRLTFGITAKAKVKIELEMDKRAEAAAEKKAKKSKKKEESAEAAEEVTPVETAEEKPKKAKKEKVAKEVKA